MTLKSGSTRVVISFPPGLQERAATAAKNDGRSLSNWVIRLIEREVATTSQETSHTLSNPK